MDLQHGIVRRDVFERDIGVPANGGKAASITELMSEPTSLLLLLTADYADLVSQFAALFG